MGRCKNCGVEMDPEETCVFATYKTNVGGREIIVCCPNCASDLEQAATQPAGPAPPVTKPARKPARKAKRPGRIAAGTAHRRVKKAVKAKKPARKPAGRRRK